MRTGDVGVVTIPKWEMKRLSKGYKPAVDKIRGRMAKIGFFGPKNEISGPKKRIHFLILTMFWPRPEKVVQRKKVRLPK